jgi:hypothetical protein
MFSFLTGKLPIKSDMVEYMKEQTNNSVAKYTSYNKNTKNDCYTIDNNSRPNSGIVIYYISFLSLFSFLAGYHFSHIMKNIRKN